MSYIDFALNLIGLLLWINWRSLGFIAAPSALSIVSAVRPADKARGGRLAFLALVPALVGLRALFYWQLGGPLNWTPKLPLGMLVVPFKCETFGRYLLYSVFSFGLAVVMFYLWLLLLSAIQGRALEPDPLTKLVRQHLGFLGRWPGWAQVLLPFVLTAALWPGMRWLFAQLAAMPPVYGVEPLARQALGMSLGVVLAWKYLLAGLLLLYWLNNYVYFGAGSFWNFITLAGRRLMTPLRWLHLGKLDLGPVVGVLVVLAVCEGLEQWPRWWPGLEAQIFH